MEYILVRGEIKSGYGVASGKGKDERYPEGALNQQFKGFLGRGLDLSNYFMGTINLDISPCSYEIKKLKHFFKNILELIFPKIEGLEYSLMVDIGLKKDQLEIIAN